MLLNLFPSLFPSFFLASFITFISYSYNLNEILMEGHSSAICALLTVPTTHLHTHTGFRGDCSLRQHTLHWVPYTHTTTALSLIFSCMVAPPTKHFTLPPLKLHITFHTKAKPTLESRIYEENQSKKHHCVWLGRDVICARMKSKSDIHLSQILLVVAQWLVFWCRGEKERSYFSEHVLNSIK